MTDHPQLTPQQRRWALAAAIPFLLSLALLGYAIAKQTLLAFAIGWPILQVFGYAMTLRIAKGDFSHVLVKGQVMLHVMALGLLVAVLARAS
ncbi:pyridoxal phosphate biosynthetic protein [Altererythrobacter lutimaris]|uniref:Pyridoxal phosphate biosynthetic protein n=1 Tax=Altererythrobacter lutimaris TaxID=2743979 RepID=A0A850HAL1_9SPHN|nr:pyridoxal phosphate biosynthetic protein [Altererythrobacter lutimaris]NVE94530.1 pyridoxal phosphate biosynthetic protein [Altererythrobacter lutimaris]